MGAQLGNLGWAHLPGLSDMVERGSGGGVSLSLCGSSVKGTWREGFLPGGPQRIFKKGSGDEHLFT